MTNRSNNDLLQAALSYAARGWPVFPCKPGGKTPLTTHGFQDATTDEATIRGWWQSTPAANIGIATGTAGLVVIDIDCKDNVSGIESWRDLCVDLHLTENTPTVETPSGGQHLYYLAGDTEIRNSAGKLGPGLDVRAVGGYVVAPPSRTPEGEYSWAMGASLDDVAIPEFPSVLVVLLRAPAPVAPITLVTGESISQGSRNETLASLAGTMRRRGMTPEAIEAALLAENTVKCNPPLLDDEVIKIAASVARYEPASSGTGAPPILTGYHLTDLGNAERLIASYGSVLRYCEPLGGWFVWDSQRWVPDITGQVRRLAKATVASMYHEASTLQDDNERKSLARWALASESASRQRNMLELAWSEPEVPVLPDTLDADPWALNVLNGTIDLRTGDLRPHDQAAMITHLAPVEYDPDVQDPIFDRYLLDATGGDKDFANYLQKAVGYTLAGVTDEEVFFLLLGEANTGKSSLIEALLAMLGTYGVKTSFETFLASKHNAGQARPDVMAMRGARLVAAVEPAQGRHLAEAELKELTGGDTIAARNLYQSQISFRPTFTIWLAANKPPKMTDDDTGLWRRIKRLPFESVVPEDARDPAVKRYLLSPEGGKALLSWAVKGCLAWQREGLRSCASVASKTAALRAEFDPIAEFIGTHCIVNRRAEVSAKDLRGAYEDWASEMGARPINNRDWGQRLRALGCENTRTRQGGVFTTIWQGIGLITDESDPDCVQDVQDETPFLPNFLTSQICKNLATNGVCSARGAQQSDTEGANEASMPIMVTRQMRLDLEYAGYTPAEIDAMTPGDAWARLKR